MRKDGSVSVDLMALEQQGWQALSSGGESAAEFYEHVLDDNPVMVLARRQGVR